MNTNGTQQQSANSALPQHNAQGYLPPRHGLVNIIKDEDAKEKIKKVYGDAWEYAYNVIDYALPENKLTFAMLLGLKVDYSGCASHVSNAPKQLSPMLNEPVKKAISDILGEENLENALFVYNSSPPEQVLLATMLAITLQEKQGKKPSDSKTK